MGVFQSFHKSGKSDFIKESTTEHCIRDTRVRHQELWVFDRSLRIRLLLMLALTLSIVSNIFTSWCTMKNRYRCLSWFYLLTWGTWVLEGVSSVLALLHSGREWVNNRVLWFPTFFFQLLTARHMYSRPTHSLYCNTQKKMEMFAQ